MQLSLSQYNKQSYITQLFTVVKRLQIVDLFTTLKYTGKIFYFKTSISHLKPSVLTAQVNNFSDN